MSVSSMTGFARAEGMVHGTGFAWELRSVNGKGLEVRLRLPPGLERLETSVRQAVQRRFGRGNIQATLTLARQASVSAPVINEALLREVAARATQLAADHGLAPPSADGLLALRGVMEPAEPEQGEEERAANDAALLAGLERAIEALAAARAAEGQVLAPVLLGHVAAIEVLSREAEADPARDPAAIRARIGEQVRLLLGASSGLDEARLHQEAALLATRADVREELDRLAAHVAAARELIETGGPVGRKLDFLSQEFIRESNTLCSKSNAASLTAIGLRLKGVVDQFREQVQNLE
jgi:uncharacterized protein (TIGR00255 family)